MTVTEPLSLDHKFDDIEMLEIPDDDVGTMSETEGISEGSSTGDDDDLFNSKTSYVELNEWLTSSKQLEFHLDDQKYKTSLKVSSDYSKLYISYVESMYKSIEKLCTNIPTIVAKPKQEFGLITQDDTHDMEIARNNAISDTFEALASSLHEFISNLESITQDENVVVKFQNLFSIIECLQGNYFYSSITTKPELLAQWINRFDHIPEDEFAIEVMVTTPKPYLHPQFWNEFIVQLVTRGLLSQATEAIGKSKFEELQETCPELYEMINDFKTLLSNYSNFALKNQFPLWKLTACELRDTVSKQKSKITDFDSLQILNHVYDLLCIVTGLPKTIAAYCDNWYTMFISLSLYQIRDDPSIYKEYYQLSVQEKPMGHLNENDIYEVAESCFVNIMEENFLKVLKTVHDFDPATAAYISKLLELKGYLQIYYTGTNKNRDLQDLIEKRTFSDYFLIRHAYESLNIHDLVPVGIGILLNDSISSSTYSQGITVIREFLPKYHCKTNDDLEWALTICAKLNLTDTAKELYYIHGLKSLEDGHIFEALNMLVNSLDSTGEHSKFDGMKQIHYITWEYIFQDALLNNRPVDDELINNIVNNNVDESFNIHPVLRHCLAPYAVLYAFFQSIETNDGKVSRTLSKLIHLLRFNHLPKKFHPLTLCQFLPFLIDTKYQFELPDLMLIIDLIDTYEATTTDQQVEEGEELYTYAINHFESEVQKYDWRNVLKSHNIAIPGTFKQLVKLLRNEIVAKIGKVFIET
jgi:nuclear pore complex protein Nup85